MADSGGSLRLGVIGHLEVPAAVIELLRARLRAWYEANGELTVVGTLKPGAAQVTAAMANGWGARLEVIIPSDNYEGSFPDIASLDTYRQLRDQATVLKLSHTQPSDEAFADAGRTVIDTSDQVLAVWDGRPARRPSGTAQLVAYAIGQGKPVEVVWLKKLFMSYNFRDYRAVARVYYQLRKQPAVEPFFWGRDDPHDLTTWITQLGSALGESGSLVVFAGATPGDVQESEIRFAVERGLPVWAVGLADDMPTWVWIAAPHITADADDVATWARRVARRIVEHVDPLGWVPDDGLPLQPLFDYEKEIIDAYASGSIDDRSFGHGAPETWPPVRRKFPRHWDNEVEERLIGRRRGDDARVLVDAREGSAPAGARTFTFEEAAPRQRLYHPSPGLGRNLSVRVVVSGGVTPGTNAVVSEIARRHQVYAGVGGYQIDLLAFVEGFRGLFQGGPNALVGLGAEDREAAHRGGSRIGTSRLSELLSTDPSNRRYLTQILDRLGGVDILYVIGGDGSMRAAHALATVASQREDCDLAVIGVPKTTDNDLLWAWRSIGHASCVQRAREFILDLHTEVTSNPRLCVIQLFGSDSGFVVASAALASNVCNAVLIPEEPFVLNEVCDHLKSVLQSQFGSMPHALLAMGETAIPVDVDAYLDDEDVGLTGPERAAVEKFLRDERRVWAQTPDALRAAGLRIVTRVLEREIRLLNPNWYWKSFRVVANEPRHLIRSMPPTADDVVLAERLGAHAVDAAMAGFFDCMVSQWLTEWVLVPLELVVLGRKRVYRGGAFWGSVLAGTGQPDFRAE